MMYMKLPTEVRLRSVAEAKIGEEILMLIQYRDFATKEIIKTVWRVGVLENEDGRWRHFGGTFKGTAGWLGWVPLPTMMND